MVDVPDRLCVRRSRGVSQREVLKSLLLSPAVQPSVGLHGFSGPVPSHGVRLTRTLGRVSEGDF